MTALLPVPGGCIRDSTHSKDGQSSNCRAPGFSKGARTGAGASGQSHWSTHLQPNRGRCCGVDVGQGLCSMLVPGVAGVNGWNKDRSLSALTTESSSRQNWPALAKVRAIQGPEARGRVLHLPDRMRGRVMQWVHMMEHHSVLEDPKA